MKTNTRIFCLLIFLATFLSAGAKGKKEITILHTNDTHSCILPLSSNLADTLLAGRGGYLRRLNMIKEERKKDPKLPPSTVATSHRVLLIILYIKVTWKWD